MLEYEGGTKSGFFCCFFFFGFPFSVGYKQPTSNQSNPYVAIVNSIMKYLYKTVWHNRYFIT